jgi:hypothetical protein
MAKFFRRGHTQVWYVAAIAAPAVPTIAVLNAGTQLTASIGDMEGWSFANEPIDTPSLDSPWVSKIPGPDAAEDSALVFYEDDTTNTLRTTLAKGTDGFIVIKSNGSGVAALIATDIVDVFKVEVSATPRAYSLGNEAATWKAQFTITDPPNIDVATV